MRFTTITSRLWKYIYPITMYHSAQVQAVRGQGRARGRQDDMVLHFIQQDPQGPLATSYQAALLRSAALLRFTVMPHAPALPRSAQSLPTIGSNQSISTRGTSLLLPRCSCPLQQPQPPPPQPLLLPQPLPPPPLPPAPPPPQRLHPKPCTLRPRLHPKHKRLPHLAALHHPAPHPRPRDLPIHHVIIQHIRPRPENRHAQRHLSHCSWR